MHMTSLMKITGASGRMKGGIQQQQQKKKKWNMTGEAKKIKIKERKKERIMKENNTTRVGG